MKVLLDTNIIIHREARTVKRSDIGYLFLWLDKLNYQKCIHPLTIEEISQHTDQRVVQTFQNKLLSYYALKTIAPDTPEIQEIRASQDRSQNDVNDTNLLNELANDRVDIFITEDRGIHRKGKRIGVAHRIFTIDGFLEKVTAENPEQADYKVLSVRKEHFGNIDLTDDFFDSFREDYPGFDQWFNKKSDEIAYYCTGDNGEVVAFLFLKIEDIDENYSDMNPPLEPKRRLKIGTFKVISNGFKIGERFIKIIFDNAVRFNTDEIYVTVYDNDQNKLRLKELLTDWGFIYHGIKPGAGGDELVLIRPCSPEQCSQATNTKKTYPFAHGNKKKWIVPIYPKYHTELFPDSVLNTESPEDFIENTPSRNSLSKVYICRSIERGLSPGDIITFYRTASGGLAWYTSVATTLGVVQSVITNIRDEKHFIELCRKRSVFSDQELAEHWNYNKHSRPFVVNFLYLYSFPKRMNRKSLVEHNIIGDAPRGFQELSNDQFSKLLGESNVDRRLIVD